MKLSKDIEDSIRTQLPDDDYDRILVAAELTGLPVNDIVDFTERNWEEDKFRFNDEDEVLEEIYIDFSDRADGQDRGRKTACIMFCKFSYLDIATAIALNKDHDEADVPGEVWSYLLERSDFPHYAELGDADFAGAEKKFIECKPDFSNLTSDNSIGLCKDSIRQITEHLAELGYFGGLSI